MSNASIEFSGPSILYQYIPIKWKEGWNLLLTSVNICLIIFALIVASVRWYNIRSWRSLKILSYINILLSLIMCNAFKMFLDFFAPIPKTFLIVFLTRLSVSSLTLWFIIMSWNTFANPLYSIFLTCFVKSALGWISVVGYSALFAYLGEGLFSLTVVAVALAYVLHVKNVYIIIKILTKEKKYYNRCEIIRMLLYSTDAFIILVFMHVREYVPEWSDTMWECILAVQVISPILYICSGEFCKLYRILLDKDYIEELDIANGNFEFQCSYTETYLCPLMICYYKVVQVSGRRTAEGKAKRVPYYDGKPKASKAGLDTNEDGKPKASNATPTCEWHNGIPYYQDGKPNDSNAAPRFEHHNGIHYYQDGKPNDSNATPRFEHHNRIHYYQDGKPNDSNATPRCECPNGIQYMHMNHTTLPFYVNNHK